MSFDGAPRCKRRGWITALLLVVTFTQVGPQAGAVYPSFTLTPCEANIGDRVTVQGNGVASGYMAYVYWDIVQPWNGYTGVLNATNVAPSGHFNMTITVPECAGGSHWVWVGDPVTGAYSQSLIVVKPSLSPSDPELLGGESLRLEGRGFGNASDVAFMLYSDEAPLGDWPATSGTQTDVYNDVLRGHLGNVPVKPGSASFNCESEVLEDAGGGCLESLSGGAGTINYVTGEYLLRFTEPHTENAAVHINYAYYENDPEAVTVLSKTVKAGSRGAFSTNVEISGLPFGVYMFAAMDSKNNTATAELTLSPPVTLSKSQVDVGDLLLVRGSEFSSGTQVEATLVDGSGVYPCSLFGGGTVDLEGRFQLSIFVPQVPESGPYTVKVAASDGVTSHKTVNVNELASLTSSIQSKGDEHSVTIKGKNFPNIQGQQVTISLVDSYGSTPQLTVGTVYTDHLGAISKTFLLKTSGPINYRIVAATPDETIFAESTFQVTPLKVQLSETQGKPGAKITLTGSGFTKNSHWNATLGDTTVVSTVNGVTTSKGTLKIGSGLPSFKVPSVNPGEYTLTISDAYTRIRFSTSFTVLPSQETPLLDTVYPIPKLTFNANPLEGEPVTFDASASSDPDGVIIYYSIDFGDGESSNRDQATHTYQQDGVYRVKLTVRDNKGAVSTLEDAVTVDDLDPIPDFSVNRRIGYKPLTVAFTDKTMSHDSIASWLWVFGDGTTSTEVAPNHTYLLEGEYTVTLRVIETDGDEATVTRTGLLRVLGDDSQPPNISNVYQVKTEGNIIIEAIVVDDSDIKNVELLLPSFGAIEMTDNPKLPGLYKAELPGGVHDTWITIKAVDYNGNEAKQEWFIPGVFETRTSLSLCDGWNQVTIQETVGFIDVSELVRAVNEASYRLKEYHEANGLDGFQQYKVVSVWTHDEYRGYLFYDAASDYGDLNELRGGETYWVMVDGFSFNQSPLEVYVVFS
jgi:PKD repeat protein